MSRRQLALNVTDLAKAIAFYSKLFGTARTMAGSQLFR
jgi:predicted enzyme related to lactoylglutathione lyase